jgi:hypothetical protein
LAAVRLQPIIVGLEAVSDLLKADKDSSSAVFEDPNSQCSTTAATAGEYFLVVGFKINASPNVSYALLMRNKGTGTIMIKLDKSN